MVRCYSQKNKYKGGKLGNKRGCILVSNVEGAGVLDQLRWRSDMERDIGLGVADMGVCGRRLLADEGDGHGCGGDADAERKLSKNEISEKENKKKARSRGRSTRTRRARLFSRPPTGEPRSVCPSFRLFFLSSAFSLLHPSSSQSHPPISSLRPTRLLFSSLLLLLPLSPLKK